MMQPFGVVAADVAVNSAPKFQPVFVVGQVNIFLYLFIEIVQNNYGLCPVSVTILPRFLSNVLYK